MDRERAHSLWQAVLEQREVPERPAEWEPLFSLWRGAGATAADCERLSAALRGATDPLQRRAVLVRQARRLIREAGLDPDLLSTPAAPMRGL